MNILRDRRAFLSYFSGLGLTSTLFPGVLWAKVADAKTPQLTLEMLRDAAAVSGLEFTDEQLQQILKGISENAAHFRAWRDLGPIDNSIAPAMHFSPLIPGMKIDRTRRPFRPSAPPRVARPANLEEVAFWPVTQLAELIRMRQVASIELTEMYLARVKRHNPVLKAFVTVTEDLALRQARQADQEIAAGRYRGPLHGIPWGIKDLFAVKGYPTTWGAAPFKDRIIDAEATIVTRLAAAGAVLLGKLATGELALDDRWFGGQTMNPWDTSMGSQGSSAGPASATAGGLVGFSVGTETWGSIIAPSVICGVTGLRPTYGRVPRTGGMILTWSMDKAGPMCRSVEDCALVLNAIQGPDESDLAALDVPFNWDAAFDFRKLRVGYLKAAFEDSHQTPQVDANDRAALEKIRSFGIDLIEIRLPEYANVVPEAVLYGEANAALRDPLETHRAELVRQDRNIRHETFSFVTATDYVNANRARMLLMQEMDKVMSKVDVYLLPFDYADYTPNPIAARSTAITNFTGHPSVTVPHGFDEKGHPTGLTFVGKLFGEAGMLALAKAYQDATGWHLKHPKLQSICPAGANRELIPSPSRSPA